MNVVCQKRAVLRERMTCSWLVIFDSFKDMVFLWPCALTLQVDCIVNRARHSALGLVLVLASPCVYNNREMRLAPRASSCLKRVES